MPNVLLMAWVNVQNTQVLQAYSTHSCVDVSLACCRMSYALEPQMFSFKY